MRFKGKSVVITGGDKGIGRATALAFAAEGAKIVIGYFKDQKAADETIALAEHLAGEIELFKMDVRVKSDCIKLIDIAVKRYGRLDIAVNNAGVSTMNWAVDLTEEEWDFNMDVNAKGVFLCCQAEARQFIKQGGGGKIINVGSIASKRPAQLLAHYAASKFAVLGFAKSLASEVAQYKINVNCVCPGLVKTSMQDREAGWEAEIRGISEEEVKESYVQAIPLGRLEESEDVAKLILFLASDDANYITGQAFNVAGGMEMAV